MHIGKITSQGMIDLFIEETHCVSGIAQEGSHKEWERGDGKSAA
jgi:hypothetical protein